VFEEPQDAATLRKGGHRRDLVVPQVENLEVRIRVQDVARDPIQVVVRNKELFQLAALADARLRWPFTNAVV